MQELFTDEVGVARRRLLDRLYWVLLNICPWRTFGLGRRCWSSKGMEPHIEMEVWQEND
jgi:hypothetical protein